MSRGHGVRERQVLACLRRYAAVTRGLGAWDEPGAFLPIAAIADEEATRSEIESVRRACKSLAAAGLVDLRRDTEAGSPLCARLCVDGNVERSTGQPLPSWPPEWVSVDLLLASATGQHL